MPSKKRAKKASRKPKKPKRSPRVAHGLTVISARPVKVGREPTASEYAEFARAAEVLEHHREWLRSFAGVIGVEVGPKIKQGRPADAAVIRVHVSRKRSPDALHPEHRLPTLLDGVPVDVIESRYKATSLASSLCKRRELVGGVSIGVPGTTTLATLACLCVDDSGTAFALTAGHPFVNAPLVCQPAGGGQGDLVGAAAKVELNKDLDAAIVAIRPNVRELRGGAAGCWGPKRLGSLVAGSAKYEPVLMVGAMSGWRRGLARMLSTPVPVDYPPPTGQLMMENQIHLISEDGESALNQPGDSGSLLLSEDGEVALGVVIAAGDPDGDGPGKPFGIATPIQTVVKRLGVKLANPS